MIAPTRYDELPYPSLSYAQSHPDRLATVATLMGLGPAPIEHCRVLELGCAGGGNVIPMAYGLPSSEFVGVDNSARQIGEGQAMVDALGLGNVLLRCEDILDLGADLGLFDYIIAHGVFSWVPRTVQDKLLQICRTNLAPRGVAYISYNTYPGWHFLGAIRGMMLYHTRNLTDLAARAREAWELLNFLTGAVPADNGPYGSFLHTYIEFLRTELQGPQDTANALLLHDELEEINEPCYFYQFIDRAAACDLQYLGEAEFSAMMGSRLPPQVFERIDRMATSVVDLEQYIDFLGNRTFRQTLLCHRGIAPSRLLKPEQLQSLYLGSHAQPTTADPDIHAVSVVRFKGEDGASLAVDHPLTKAAMLTLAEAWPRAIPFDELIAMACARLADDRSLGREGADLSLDKAIVGANLLKAYGYSGSLAELHVQAPKLTTVIGECPRASAVARYQAQHGVRVTNLRHERVILDELDRHLYACLDGQHDRVALVQSLLEGPAQQGLLHLERDGQLVEDASEAGKVVTEEVNRRLQWLARAGLLEG
jgi:methyltransferase-like protein/2-polyprenyl-3-methyl-5-hydroxy-6-metoxy-1,4-benzoquinol methylase